jgi:hypothetical protein
LRVKAELQLRLHQQAWELLRESQEAALAAFHAVRAYHLVIVTSASSPTNEALRAERDKSQEVANAALSRFTSLAYCTPPAQQGLRDSASEFTRAFNEVQRDLLQLNKGPVGESLTKVRAMLDDALGGAMRTIAEWNEVIWQHQTAEELAPAPKQLNAK